MNGAIQFLLEMLPTLLGFSASNRANQDRWSLRRIFVAGFVLFAAFWAIVIFLTPSPLLWWQQVALGMVVSVINAVILTMVHANNRRLQDLDQKQ